MDVSQRTAVVNQVNTGNQQIQQGIQQYGFYYAYQHAIQAIVQDTVVPQYCSQGVGDVTLSSFGFFGLF